MTVPVGSSVPGNTPISDEAGRPHAFVGPHAGHDVGMRHEGGSLASSTCHDCGVSWARAAAPLLVSAEAERQDDELFAESRPVKITKCIVEGPEHRALVAEVEGLRAELAGSQFKFEQMRRERDTADAIAANWKVRVTELNAAVAALRAAGGQG